MKSEITINCCEYVLVNECYDLSLYDVIIDVFEQSELMFTWI